MSAAVSDPPVAGIWRRGAQSYCCVLQHTTACKANLGTSGSSLLIQQHPDVVSQAVDVHVVVLGAGGSSDLFRYWEKLLKTVVGHVCQLGAMVLRDHELETPLLVVSSESESRYGLTAWP